MNLHDLVYVKDAKMQTFLWFFVTLFFVPILATHMSTLGDGGFSFEDSTKEQNILTIIGLTLLAFVLMFTSYIVLFKLNGFVFLSGLVYLFYGYSAVSNKLVLPIYPLTFGVVCALLCLIYSWFYDTYVVLTTRGAA